MFNRVTGPEIKEYSDQWLYLFDICAFLNTGS